MDNSGHCSLVISGENLNLTKISEDLQLQPTKRVRKGEKLKIGGECPQDVWAYHIQVDELTAPDRALETLLLTIGQNGNYLRQLADEADVRVKCYVQSDYAQVFFRFSPDVIRALANLNIPFDISILSWGGADLE